ncbi:MAG: TonB family protein [Gammaproteobacteria bacterium]|nr:TonB family protein [Gammaproteobacteria bacterium]
MEFRKRHWALALPLAVLLQLALVSVLFHPNRSQRLPPPGGVLIELGSAVPSVGGGETRATVVNPEPTTPSSASQATNETDAEPPLEQPPLVENPSQSTTAATPEPVPMATTAAVDLTDRKPSPPRQARVSRIQPPPQRVRAASAHPPPPHALVAKVTDDTGNGTRMAPTQPAVAGDGTASESAAGNRREHSVAGKEHAGEVTAPSPDYYRRLTAWLEQHKSYPRLALLRRQQGVVRVSFKIDRQGNLLSRQIVASSGFQLLDQAAEALLLRASPMPEIPAQSRAEILELVVPIRYALN